jgi:hypothetical protein
MTRAAADSALCTTLCLVLTLVLGCADRTPASIGFKDLPPLVLSTSPFSLEGSVLNKDGKPLAGHPLSFSISTSDVAELSESGSFRCLQSGDAMITVTAAGLSTTLPMKCRIATQIAVPESLMLILGDPPVKVNARALGQGERPLPDVPVELTSSDASIMTASDGSATPVALGKATLKASVGPIASAIPVEVVERIVSERLMLKDGAKQVWTLEPGEYRVEIDVESAFRVPHGVIVSWNGATCDDQPEKRSHRLLCDVPQTATLTVTNPTQMGLGATLWGPIKVYRVSNS